MIGFMKDTTRPLARIFRILILLAMFISGLYMAFLAANFITERPFKRAANKGDIQFLFSQLNSEDSMDRLRACRYLKAGFFNDDFVMNEETKQIVEHYRTKSQDGRVRYTMQDLIDDFENDLATTNIKNED